MTKLTILKYPFLILLSILLLPATIKAQLKAGFSMDKSAGCAPLAVAFTNTTTGASAAATYLWDFGNGNTSVLRSPGALFQVGQTYTVTLTVTDGTQRSSASGTVTVYKKPEVDFAASLPKGCAPLPVTLTSVSSAGSGTISSYYWDFGDGSTQQQVANSVTHTYTAVQRAAVSLTVTNSYGCVETATKAGVVDIAARIQAGFSADQTVLCKESDPVQMTNTSSGPGALSYQWDFGDGTTSTAENPAHVFNKKGTYTVKLVVASSEGCADTATQAAYLNIADYASGFSLPDLVCAYSTLNILNSSTPLPSASLWQVNGQQVDTRDLRYSFGAPGTYTVKQVNTFGACKDSLSKTVQVQPRPYTGGFLVNPKGFCGAPAEVEFRDTTSSAVKWEWSFNGPYSGVQSTLQAPTHTFTYNDYHQVRLKVFNAAGCSTDLYKQVNIRPPTVDIYYGQSSSYYGYAGCESVALTFTTLSSEELVEYFWKFGDGTTSTEVKPYHRYGAPGTYYVELQYKTKSGCTGTSRYSVRVDSAVKASFSVSKTDVCATEKVRFTSASTGQVIFHNWFVNGKFVGSGQEIDYRFADTGIYTIKLIVFNNVCKDSMEMVDLIKVKPPIPKILTATNTCDGTRGEVTFTQKTIDGTSWTWDFRDGSVVSFTTDQQQVKHTYTKSGTYTALLTASNGTCSAKDSIYFHVLVKQNPLLTINKAELCPQEELGVKVTNFDRNYSVPLWLMVQDYYLHKVEYGDGSVFEGTYKYPGYYWDFIMSGFQGGRENMRVIMKSTNFNCYDTTNYVPLKVKGAAAAFEVVQENACLREPVILKDVSKTVTSTIQSWQWDFGDNQRQVLSQGGTVQHHYAAPGTYQVSLKVTDASGCTSVSSSTAAAVRVSGPKAAFSVAATTVPLNTTVQFINTTNTANSPSTSYEWLFGDGTSSAASAPAHTYTVAGDYIVKLIARNTQNGCTDTAVLDLRVNAFDASFTMSTSFIGNNSCPPVLARFLNTSKSSTRIWWDFGDGTRAEGVTAPSHIYTAPGVYPVTLRVEGANGLTGTFTDTVVVRKPAPLMTADVLHGCTSQSITFSAKAQQGVTYLWDLGDGMVASSADSFYRFHYSRHGVYHPAVVVKDANGCLAAAPLAQPVVIDSLLVDLATPSTICTPREVAFRPTVVSTTPGGVAVERSYHWDFGTGVEADTSNLPMPSFTFSQPGNYTVRLAVATPYGCRKEVSVPIRAFQGLGAVINGPQAICEGESATFTGSTRLPGQPNWKWNFHDGTSAGQATAPPKTYSVPGTFPVQLLVDNVGCVDTLTAFLQVHPKPVVRLSSAQAFVCEGASVALTASGGSTYSWAPATGLGTTAGATVTASPARNTTYTVTATSDFGCTASGAVTLTVVYPPEVQLPAAADVCAGESVQLKASGAATYQWVGNTAGLSATVIAQPLAAPAASTVYTVVGTDAHGCFNDTASIAVAVKPRPTVDAGASVELLAGATLTLQPTASADVVRWNWSPPQYLSCSGCAAPDATPLEPITYTLTVANADGCTASDTVSVSLLCTESRVYIPNTFTPNHDGVNDVFALKGYGIRQVKSLRIYNRWGEVVFERKDFEPGDQSAAWDGRYKGLPVPVGSYVYIAQMSCNGQEFTRRGTVTVVY